MSRPLNKLTYESIYIIDNLFDDDPAEWNRLSASIRRFTPATIQSVVSGRDSRKPCGLFRHMYAQSLIIKELFDDHPEYIKLFNGMAYSLAQAGTARNKLMHENDPEARCIALMDFAKWNLQTSCIARAVHECANDQTRTGNREPYSLVEAAMPILLSDTFVQVHDPRIDATKKFLDTSTGVSILSEEEYYQVTGDWAEMFADLDVEENTGFITPNAAACYCRIRRPDINLIAIKAGVQSGTWENDKCISTDELRRISPDLAHMLDELVEPYRGEGHQAEHRFFAVSLKAKEELRTAQEREKVRSYYVIRKENEDRIGQTPDNSTPQSGACDLLLRCERRIAGGEPQDPHYYLSLENVEAFRTICDNLGIRIGDDRIAEPVPKGFEGFVALKTEEITRIALAAVGEGRKQDGKTIFTVPFLQAMKFDDDLKHVLITAFEDLEFMLSENGISRQKQLSLVRAGVIPAFEIDRYLPDGMRILDGEDRGGSNWNSPDNPGRTFEFLVSPATAGRIEAAALQAELAQGFERIKAVSEAGFRAIEAVSAAGFREIGVASDRPNSELAGTLDTTVPGAVTGAAAAEATGAHATQSGQAVSARPAQRGTNEDRGK